MNKPVCQRKPRGEPLNDLFGWRAHDAGWPQHSGDHGHYCWDWDGLWICKDCMEYKHCACVKHEPA